MPSAKSWLIAEFAKRRSKNHRYSLRMFARQMGVPSGRISELMNGKRGISRKLAEKLAAKLLLGPEEKPKFIELAKAGKKPADPGQNPHAASESSYLQLSADAFHAIADWYHFAILSLIHTKDFHPDPHWIAARLGITAKETTAAMERLERLGLLLRKGKRCVPGAKNISTPTDLESVALKISHRQTLEQAIAAIEEVPIDKRDITSITFAADLERLPKAKEMIRKFRYDLCEFLESGKEKTEVFNLNIQLVPITKLDGEEKT